MTRLDYKQVGGIHPETASVKNILAFNGVVAPHSGKAFTEEMLLGIGGGLGATYILWEFEKHKGPSLVLGFRNNLNYPVKFLTNLGNRIGLETTLKETSGAKKATSNLEEALAEGNPVIAWLDLGGKPYYMHFLLLGVAVIFGLDHEFAYLDQRASKPFAITREHLTKARGKVPSFKNRLMTLTPARDYDIEKAILNGIEHHIKYLGASSESFALPSLRKWGKMMTHKTNKKGWPGVFKEGKGLFFTLRTVYEGITQTGAGGNGLRSMYAEFLREAAPVVGKPGLLDVAQMYDELAKRWAQLANTALPKEIGEFKETKELLERREKLILANGSESLEEIEPLNDRLYELKGTLNDDFPMDENQRTILFERMQSQIKKIYESEVSTLETLKQEVTKSRKN